MVGSSLYAWFAWLPVIILWAFLIFIIPFLGLIVAVVFAAGAVAALGALVWRTVEVLETFVRFVLRRRPRDDRAPRARATGLTAQPQPVTALQHHRY